MKPSLWISIAGLSLLLACTPRFVLWPTGESASPSAAVANPASVYCLEHGGTSFNRVNTQGAQTGYCLFKDQTYCEEFDYFRGQCQQGDKPVSEIL